MRKAVLLIFGCLAITGCTDSYQPLTQKNSSLTQGNVQMNIIVGKTTKAEVLEKFGAPNITTRDGSGTEVWTYQRAAQVSQSSSKSGYWTVIFGGGGSQKSGFESSSSMMTLIIKFNDRDLVIDCNSRSSIF